MGGGGSSGGGGQELPEEMTVKWEELYEIADDNDEANGVTNAEGQRWSSAVATVDGGAELPSRIRNLELKGRDIKVAFFQETSSTEKALMKWMCKHEDDESRDSDSEDDNDYEDEDEDEDEDALRVPNKLVCCVICTAEVKIGGTRRCREGHIVCRQCSKRGSASNFLKNKCVFYSSEHKHCEANLRSNICYRFSVFDRLYWACVTERHEVSPAPTKRPVRPPSAQCSHQAPNARLSSACHSHCSRLSPAC
jgi:hypothetical protein